jgi:amidase
METNVCYTVADNCVDDADLVHGMPVSLQLIGNRLQEEKVLAMTGTVLQAMNSSPLSSFTDNIITSVKAGL